MREIFFVIKIFIVTVALVLLLQIKLGEDTLESYALVGLRESQVAVYLQEVGTEGWKVLRKSAGQMSLGLGKTFSAGDDRLGFFKLERSKAVVEEKIEKEKAAASHVKEEIKETLESQIE